MQTATKHISDETRVADLLEGYDAAIRRKDAEATVAFYTRDAISYDLAPPLQIETDAVHDPKYIQEWFDTWKGPIGSESHDQRLVVGAGVAYAFGLRRMTGTKKDGTTVDLWFRSSACLRIEDGAWKIAHVHNSVPFAMDGSGRALLDLKP